MSDTIEVGDRVAYTAQGITYAGVVRPVLRTTECREIQNPAYAFVCFDDGTRHWMRKDKLTKLAPAAGEQEPV